MDLEKNKLKGGIHDVLCAANDTGPVSRNVTLVDCFPSHLTFNCCIVWEHQTFAHYCRRDTLTLLDLPLLSKQ